MGIDSRTSFMKKSNHVPRWSIALFLAGFVFGSFLPSLDKHVQAAPRRANALDVVINEVAWMGTDASQYDEWIELYNPTAYDIDLTNWKIITADDSPATITIPSGSISAGGYFLLERADKAVSDISADYVYGGQYFNNNGESLTLQDNLGYLIDTANISGGEWDAGISSPDYASMERIAVIADSASAWATNNGITFNGKDASSNPLRATPKQANSVSYIPLSIIINEVAWAGTQAYFGDEWMELYNPSAYDISLDGWRLASDSGNVDIFLSGTLVSGGYLLLERGSDGGATNQAGVAYTSGLLDDTGDTLRLLAPDRTVIDTANGDGGAWSHGRTTPASSMERMSSTEDADENWVTSVIQHASAKDAAGNPIYGTPGSANWGYSVTQTPIPTSTATLVPSATPTAPASLAIIINEVAWAGTESSSSDEWIEFPIPCSVTASRTS